MKSAILLELLPYQAEFIADPSRFKIALWARQTGKDFTCAAEAVLDCITTPKTTWLIVAAGERQAIESLEKAKEWAEFFRADIDDFSVASRTVQRKDSSAYIQWANGSRIIALPAKPETIRGYSANVILTEFAFHENPDAIWRAIYPSISNPLRGGQKKLRIISTPNGLSNKFADLWFHNGGAAIPPAAAGVSSVAPLVLPRVAPASNATCHMLDDQCSMKTPFEAPTVSISPATYFKSKLTIHDAIAHGLPLDPAELRAGLNDNDAWAQEYLCEFTDSSTVLLPYDLIDPCESSLASESSSPQSLSSSQFAPRAPELFAGLDFARKNHLTVCWLVERVPNRNLDPNLVSPVRAERPDAHVQDDARSSMPHEKCSMLNDPCTPPAPGHTNHRSHTLLTREVLCLQNISTPEQLEILLPRLRRCRRVCLDYTGPGIGLGDYLHQQLLGRPPAAQNSPSSKLELCQFTAALKSELFPRLRAAFESRELLIPISRDIREDLHSIYRTATNSGQILYRARSSADGHADRTTALALALRAAQSIPSRAPAIARSVNDNHYSYRDARFLSPEYTLAVIY